MNYIELFRNIVREKANSVALTDKDGARETTYAALDEQSARVAGKLAAMGCRKGDFILINIGRSAEYIAAYLGVLKAGCVAVPVVPEYPKERIDYIRQNCAARAVIDENFFSDVDAYEPWEDPADGAEPALLIYTSGSTGKPKGILHGAANLARAALRHKAIFSVPEDVRYGATASLSFAAHVFEYLTVFLCGGTSFILSEQMRRSPEEMKTFFEKHKINIAHISPQMLKLMPTDTLPLRRIFTGSERISDIEPGEKEVFCLYGMSETLVGVASFALDKSYVNTPLGKAMDGVEILICDEEGRRLPDGTEGEICIRAEYDVTYWKDPERTTRMMPRDAEGKTTVHSGDIGYIDESGNLIYVNRKDWMVKINGQRVETLEIETLMQGMDGIKAAVCKAFEDTDGQTYLVAYYVASAPVREEDVRRRLEEKLAAYMVPRFLVELGELPKNENGKLDRKSLLPPSTERYKKAYVAPANETEAVLCSAFESVLQCGRVGAEDSFFSLGGDSVKTMKLVEAAGLISLTTDDILAGKTPREIAKRLDGVAKNEITHREEIPEVTPLTEAQRGIYLACMDEPESLAYHIPVLCRFPKDTDEARLLTAVKEVTSAHKALFVTVQTPNGVPSMVFRGGEVAVERKTAGKDISAACREFLQPFDMENGPLFRFALCRDKEGLCLLFDVHHIIFDGTSVETLVSEIASVYDGETVKPERLTLFDISEAECGQKEGEAYRAAQAFFREKWEDADGMTGLFPDRVTEEGASGAGRVDVSLNNKFDIAAVAEFVKEKGITENTLFLGAFAYALAKFGGMTESTFCTVNSGRHDPRLAASVGMFVKTLPLRYAIEDGMTVSDFLRTVQSDFFETVRHDCISFGELAKAYGVNADTIFVYQAELFGGTRTKDGAVRVELPETGEAQSDLSVMLLRQESGYEWIADFKRDRYTEALIRSFADCYGNVVRGMLTADTLADVSFTDGESAALLECFNRTEAPYDEKKTVVTLFREQVKKTPDKTCLVYCDKRYTYREVDAWTDRLAAQLVRMGVGREKTVGVLIPRSEYMLLCSLGVLKAGGAYLPLDPTYPAERLNLMMHDSGAMMLLFAQEFADVIGADFAGQRMTTDEMNDLPPCEAALPEPSPEDLFIMLYTSGSTGTPKGVMFEHRNALITTEWVKKYFAIDESSRVTAYASYGFDANVFDTYPAITSGAELHIISDEIRLDFPALKNYFNENGITHTVMTTQIGRQFAAMKGLTTLRHLSVAGEKLTPLDPPQGFSLYNLYGPTEGSVVTSALRVDRRYRDIPIGKPVDNLKIYVTDKQGRLLPPGAVGELCIAGPHVTRGYLNRPEKMAEAYGENTFAFARGYERLYRTGDVVRLLGDGNLQYIGRSDKQIKIRGFRVELTEIEEVIRRYDGIRDATVAAFDGTGGKYIAAYVVSDEKVDTEALAEFIRSEKPPYMVPSVTMQIDAIPLTQNQKVDRRALPVPKREMGELVPPENETQEKIASCVAEVLGHHDFGVTTDLFAAGLTSIGTVQLSVAIAEAFEVPLRMADIRVNSTVKKLETLLSQTETETVRTVRADYPLTETQNGIFVECMASPETTAYNIPLLLRLGDRVELPRLKEALTAALHAHPYVKTTLFTDEKGNVCARRNDTAEVKTEWNRCTHLPDEATLVRPFILLGEPLYRFGIYETDEGNYLFMDIHHVICDGTSESILLRDIDRAYAGETPDGERFSGYDAAEEELSLRQGARYDEAKTYWNDLLSGCDTGILPKNEPESEKKEAGNVRLNSPDTDGIRIFCEKNGLSLNAFFNTVFAFVFGRFINKEEVTFTTVYHGRNDSRLHNTVSMLVKTLPVTAAFTEETAVKDWVKTVQAQLLRSMTHDVYSFAEISRACGVSADVMFVYQGEEYISDTLFGEKTVYKPLAARDAKEPLSVNVHAKKDGFSYEVEYRKDLYSEAFARAFAEAMAAAARSFAKAEYVRDVTMLSPTGEETYDRLNATATEVKSLPVHELFECIADEKPDAPAVTASGETLTYRELNARANRMAHALCARGIGKENIVGLVLDRTTDVPVTELAIMKAGGAFLPMIPSYPDERIDYCLTNAESPLVITTEAVRAARPALFSAEKPYRTVTTEELLSEGNGENLLLPTDREQLAYCIYTSGSTGTPKGVMIEHRQFSNFVQTDHRFLSYYRDADADGAALALSSISFDMSLFEMFLPLCRGKHLCISTEEEFHNPAMLMELMVRENVQMMVCTPSFLSNMMTMPGVGAAVRKLKSIVVGAEAFPASLYETLRAAAPGLQIVNGYGPTETTICCSYKELLSGLGITIGRPTGNVKLFVTDRFGHVLPPYAVGELIICGDGVSRGYVKLPEKTSAAFFRLYDLPAYHSGDLVRLNGNAEIDFGGRIDNQVKLRGFRVELDEIEKVMSDFPSVTQSKVLVRNNGTEDYLVGFFTAEKEVGIEDLTAYMKTRLTYYMVPAVLMQLEQMPLTANGKIDKKALPEVKPRSVERKSGRAPKKSAEQRLCEIFATVLGREEVYADDNFFALGGTSLSASKVTMLLMSEGIEVKYGDIFDNPTPEELAAFIEKRSGAAEEQTEAKPKETEEKEREALCWNRVKYASEVTRTGLGNVVLTGAVGFLGIHVLDELLRTETGHIYCLVRRGSHESAEKRLKTMLIYYFGRGFEEELQNRITVVEADITDDSLRDALRDCPFDTVINCAACVKHFSDSDILDRINVGGVANLITLCLERKARLVQISTVSVPGVHTKESYEKQVRMHENELFVIDDMANKYVISKYRAEEKIFDAIEKDGLRAKVIRVGNLMGRHSDGEFQINLETNMFMSGIRGFAVMGKYPISHMTDPMSFSPVDCTAQAVVLLAGTDDKFTAFHANNRYGFDEMKIIDACNRNGIRIAPEADEVYYREFREKLGDESVNARLNGLAAYDVQDTHAVETDNLFTTNILYRIGFSWPLVDDAYLDRAIYSIMTLDYFDMDGAESGETV